MSELGKHEPLKQRTTAYASAIIRCFCSLPRQRTEVRILAEQLLRSGTSVASHYREACRSRSDAEFVSKIDGSLQEADETDLWLELLERDCGIQTEIMTWLRRETNELIAIFVTIAKDVKGRSH